MGLLWMLFMAVMQVTTAALAPVPLSQRPHNASKAAAPAHSHSLNPAPAPTKVNSKHASSPSLAPSPSHPSHRISPASSPSHAPSPPPRRSIPPVSAPPAASASISPLDPSQMAALRDLGVRLLPNPCTTSKRILVCDTGSPLRHLLALQLEYCPVGAALTTAALAELTTLQALAFMDCPMLPVHVPLKLIDSLTSFSCIASLGKTTDDPDAPGLPFLWLSKFYRLLDIAVTDVKVNGSGLSVILSEMKHLNQMTFSRTNITGVLPKMVWPPNVTIVDLSHNLLHGVIPASISKLKHLLDIDLSDNRLSGRIPNVFGKMTKVKKIALGSNRLTGPIPPSISTLPSLIYLDLSNNRLNGSIPASLGNLGALRHLDLSNNAFAGPIPFNSSFVKRFSILNLSGNSGICYDQTTLEPRFLMGIPVCDSTGKPIIPIEVSPAPVPDGATPPAGELQASSAGRDHMRSKAVVSGVAISVAAVVLLIMLVVLVSRCRARKY